MKFFDLLNTLAESKVKISALNGDLSISAPKGAVTPDLLEGVKEYKSDLLEYFSKDDATESTISLADRNAPLIVSYAQQRLWLVDQMGDSTAYNLAEALRLQGALDLDAARQAFLEIVARHETLRTCFVQGESGEPLQKIQSADAFDITVDDLSSLEGSHQASVIEDVIKGEATEPYDLSSDIMLRVRVLRLNNDEHIMLATIHHIASDGWSMSILINEFCQLYQAYALGQEVQLPDLPIQYADYAAWQRGGLQDEVLNKQLDYWENKLSNLPVAHSLPMDFLRPSTQTFNGDTVSVRLNKKTSEALNDVCQQHGATLFMGLHSAFSAILSRYSNEKDIVVGTPTANREQAEIAPLIGFFVNTLVLRSDLTDNPSFNSLLLRSKEMLLEAYGNQQAPFEQLVERLNPERTLSHSPLIQILIQIQNNEKGELNIPGLTISGIEQNHTSAKYDITLDVQEEPEGIVFRWEYNTDLFKRDTIERMANHFKRFIHQATQNPETNIFEIDFLNDAEKNELLVGYNQTNTEFPYDKCIHQLFEHKATQNPHALAVTFEDQSLTYGELNARSNQLARYLLESRKVRPEEFVGICLERSIDMVVSLLAVLKSGCAYVPLDPDYPAARLDYMLQDANLRTVLTNTALSDRVDFVEEQRLCLDDQTVLEDIAQHKTLNIQLDETLVGPQHLAYMIYTSGSTGNPKGVMVEHQALVNRIDWMDRTYGCAPADKILQKTPFSFDVSVWEFFWPLTSGASLVLAKPEGHKDPLYLSQLIQDTNITKLHFVPSMLGSMLTVEELKHCASIKQVFCSGEALSVQHVEQFHQQCPTAQLHNLYGPTEAAIDVSAWDCEQFKSSDKTDNNSHYSSIPIGKPIHNIQLLVLDEFMNPVPQGAIGELHIGGVGLARGYWNRDELTEEKFVDNPFYALGANNSKKLYKTGDLAKWLPCGNLEYLGRLDHQVKIRGFRIELGDIENALSGHNTVTNAVVIARQTPAGEKQLVAYVAVDTALASQADDENTTAHTITDVLRKHLLQQLPEYMVPANIVIMDELPITANGKINRKELPEPEMERVKVPYVAPRNEIEAGLCQLWESLLKQEQIGVNDNFFELGGNSLITVHLVKMVKEQGYNVTIKDIYQHSTIASLSDFCLENPLLEGEGSSVNLIKEGEYYPLPANRHWYFMRTEGLLGWGQSMVMQFHDTLDYSDIVQAAVEYLVQKHRSLRIQFEQNDDGWKERIAPLGDIDYFETDYVDDQLPPGMEGEVKEGLVEYQEKITFDRLFQVSYRKVAGDNADQVVLSMHHMLYDAFSLGTIVTDFVEAFMRVQVGELPTVIQDYAGIPEWSLDTKAWVESDASRESKDFWVNFDTSPYKQLPTDKGYSEKLNSMIYNKNVESSLSKSESEKLLAIADESESLSTFDILLTAIVEAFGGWTGHRSLSIEIPNGNRQSLTGDLDLVGAVGWFLDYTPLYLNLEGGGMGAVEEVASRCEDILGKGRGVNALKYFSTDSGLLETLNSLPYPEVHLNYLPPELNGTGVSATNTNSPANFSIVSQKNFESDMRERVHKLSGTLEFVDNCLVIKWEFSRKIYNEETIKQLSESCKKELLRILDDIQSKQFKKSA